MTPTEQDKELREVRMSEYFTPEQKHEKAWTDYVVTAPTQAQLEERQRYWSEQLAIAERFKEVAERELGRITLLLSGQRELGV